MNLLSCDNCGVVLEADKLDFPQGLDPSDPRDIDKMFWHRGEWLPVVPCPVCKFSVCSPHQ